MSAKQSNDRAQIDVLRKLSLTEFAAGLQCARERRDESAAVFDEYSEWFNLLEPYLRRDPSITVDQALTLYRNDCVAKQQAKHATRE